MQYRYSSMGSGTAVTARSATSTREQRLTGGMAAALLALACMVFSTTPGLVDALSRVELPALHSAAAAPKHTKAAVEKFRSDGSNLHITNRAAGISATVARNGSLSVTAGGASAVSLSTTSLSRPGHVVRLTPTAAPLATDSTATITRGAAVEWFQNRAGALQQGWTISDRPVGTGKLSLGLAITGATTRVSGRDALSLQPRHGKAISYANLLVRDSRGTKLPAHFVKTATGARIVVDDRRAHYPVVVDPDISSVETLTSPSTNQGAGFGSAIAVNGRWMAIKEPGYRSNSARANAYNTIEGRIDVYHDSTGNGSWTLLTTLSPTAGSSGATRYLQQGVRLLVEPAGVTVFGLTNSLDSVDVWTFAGDPDGAALTATPQLQQTVTITQAMVPGMNLNTFPESFAVDGNLMVIGMPNITNPGIRGPDLNGDGNPDALNEYIGAAMVFHRTGGFGTSYAFDQRLDAPNGLYASSATRDVLQKFGTSVDIDAANGLISVGAPGDDGVQTTTGGTLASPAPMGTSSNKGAIDVFKFTTGTWSQVQNLAPTTLTTGAMLGSSVTFTGGSGGILAGAPSEQTSVGAAYLYDWNGASTWSQVQRILPDDPTTGANEAAGNSAAGTSVASDPAGTHLYVGAPNQQITNSTGPYGSVFAFTRASASGAATFAARLTPPTTSNTHGGLTQAFGRGLAASSDQVVAGAPQFGTDTETLVGRVSPFSRSGNTFTALTELTPQTEIAADDFGFQIAQDGDLMAISMPSAYRSSGFGQGSVAVYHRDTTAGQWVFDQMLFPNSATQAYGTSADTLWGASVAIHQVKNSSGGDAGAVVAVGAPYDSGLNPDGSASTADVQVSHAGTVAIYQRGAGSGATWNVGTEVWAGGRAGTTANPGSTAGTTVDGNFGWSLAFTADGTLVVGEPGAPNGGAIHRYDRSNESGSTVDWTDKQTISPGAGNATKFGTNVAADGTVVLAVDTAGNGVWRYTDGSTTTNLAAFAQYPMNLQVEQFLNHNTGLSVSGNRFAVNGNGTNSSGSYFGTRVYRMVNGTAVREAEFTATGCCGYFDAVDLNHGGGSVPTVVVGRTATQGGYDGNPGGHAKLYVAKVKGDGSAQWSFHGYLRQPAADQDIDTYYGSAVANWPANGGVTVGAPNAHNNPTLIKTGAVYRFPTATVTPPPGPQAFVDVTLPPAVKVGASSVKTTGIPPSLLSNAAATSGAVAATPIGSIDFSQAPKGTAVSASPLSGIPLSGIPLSGIPLSGIPLSGIPLTVPGGWPAVLQGTAFENIPLQSVTLKDVYELASVQALPLGALTLAGSPLSSIPVASIALGDTPLSGIDINPDGSGSNISKWCQALTAAKADPAALGLDCGNPTASANADVTVLSIGVKGAPLSGIPLSGIPLSGIPLSGIPLSGIPLSGIGISGSPLSGIPLSGIPLSGIPLSGIPLSGIPLSGIPLSGIPLSGIPLSGIPLSGIPLSGINISGTPLSGIPLSGIPLSGIPLSGIPLSGIPLSGIPLSGIPLSGIPLSGIPLSGIPLSGIEIGSTPLSGIPLSGIPLSGIPLSGIPLSGIPLSGIPLSGIPLSGISVGGTPLSGIPLSGIEIGTTPLSGIPLSGIGSTLRNTLVDCTTYDCDAPGATIGTAAAAGAIKSGARVGDLSADLLKLVRLSDLIGSTTDATDDHLRSALGSRTLADLTSWGNVTLGELPQLWPYLKLSDLNGKLGGVRLSDIANHLREFTPQQVRAALDAAHVTLADITGWDDVTLGQVGVLLEYLHLGDLSNALKGLRLGDLADAIQKPGGGTYSGQELRDALTSALPGATFSDLTNLGDLTLGELGKYGDTTLGQLLTALAGSSELDRITFGDLLLTLMNPKQYPWESLDFGAISAQALDEDPIGSPVTLAYRADAPDGLPRTVRVTVQFPHGARIDTASIDGQSYGGAAELKPAIDGDVATWTFTNVPANAPQSLTFAMQSPLDIGPAQVKATAFLPEDDETSSDTATTVVKEAIEPNDTIADATTLPDDTIELSHISSADDVDVYKFSVSQPGTRVSISLSNLDADLDMVLYSPSVGSVQPTAGKQLDPVDDGAGSGLPGKDQAGTYTPQPSVGNEVRRPADLGNLAVVQGSFNRGRTNEQIDTRVLTRTGTYYLAVTGYNAAVDQQPYALRMKRFVNTEQPACPARSVTPGAQGTTLPQTLPAGTDTVFVVNQSRMAGLYGDTATDTLMGQLTGFAGWLGDQGLQKAAVLTVDADPGVRAAYAAWDASPCVPSGANGVVSEIARVLNGYRSAGADLKNVVLVGGDDAVPFARVPDRTEVANESGYTSTFSDAGNALYATFATSNVQTDNAYVDRSPYAFGDRTLYIPDTTIGRLVESPTEIGDQLADFQSAGGKLAVGTGLVTGYDFLTDGAQGIDTSVRKTYGSVSDKISDTWTRQDLEDAIHAIKPDLLSVNAHFDHYRALPAAGNAAHDESDLFQAAAVRGALNGDLAGSVVFSMGCHSGLSASDKLLSGDRALDFAQAVSSQGGVFVGNTGFGYGDTDTVALSEQLMGDFAERLNGSMSVGEALLYAKNAYFSGLAEYTPYDEKVLAETTFYGLPFYRLDVANPPANPAPVSASITPDATTGLSVATTHLAPTYASRTAENGTTYTAAIDPATGEDSLTTVQNRPVEPKVDTEYALPAGLAAHDALVLGLTSVDAPNTDPYVFQPTVDSADERVDVGVDTAFPTRAVRVNSGLTPAGETFHVAATTGYFRTTAPDGKGIQRTYKSMDVQTYLPSAGNDDWVAPTFTQVTGQVHDGVVSISAHVRDDRGDASRVKRVRMLLLQDPASGVSTVWRGLDLVRTAGSEEWTGSLPSNGRNLEFILQAVDAAGNVGVTTDKAQNFSDDGAVVGGTGDTDPTPVGDLQVTLAGTQGGENWYTGPVTVTATGGTKLVYELVGENDPTGYQEPFTLSATGLHTVRVTSADGQTQTVTVPIDRVGPVAQISSPAPGQNLPVVPGAIISYDCPDAGSGPTGCTATVDSSPIPVASGTTMLLAPGTHSVTVYAGPDRAGNPASVPTATRTFTVLGAPATVGSIGVSKAQDGAVTTLTVPFSGYSVLDYSGTVNWGDGGSTNCAMAGSACTVTRNSSGGGVLTVTHTYNTAWVDTTATVTVVDNLGQTASATVKVNKKTTLTATAALLQLRLSTNVVELKSGSISATLKDGAGNPLAGQTIKFTLPSGTSICTATTNSAGVAACPTTLTYTLAMVLAGKYNATFPGKDAWHGSAASASLIG